MDSAELKDISRIVAARVKKEAQTEDPIYRMLLAAVELNEWRAAALDHLSLIDQTQLSHYDLSAVRRAGRMLHALLAPVDMIQVAHQAVVGDSRKMGRQRAP